MEPKNSFRYRLGIASPTGFDIESHTDSREEAEDWVRQPSDQPGTMHAYVVEVCPDCLGYGDIPTGYCHCGIKMEGHLSPGMSDHSASETYHTCFKCMSDHPLRVQLYMCDMSKISA
jgi:hypothetical protein